MEKTEEIAELLRTRSLKATPIRLKVLELLSGSDTAVAYSSLQSTLQEFDRVTLYRTLNALIEKGIVHKAMSDETDTFYAICNSHCDNKHHHHDHIHFKCSACLEVSCVEVHSRLELSIPGFQLDEFQIQATGVCEGCLKK